MPKADYSKDLFRQVQELMLKCDNLSHDVKTIEKRTEQKFKKQIKEMKQQYEEKIDRLETEIKTLKIENKKLRDENDRLKKQINNNSDNSSKPPSSDIKRNIPNNRSKTTKSVGAQNGHKAHFLSKRNVEEKIKNGEFQRQIVHKGKISKEYISKYILDLKIDVIAKEYRFYKDKSGKYNIPKEFQTDVQYGNEIKTLCTILNTEGIVALDRLTNFVSCISHEKINISKGSVVNFMKIFDKKSDYVISAIENKILNSDLIYTDGTIGRVDNKNICVRTYSTKEATLLVPTKGKGKKYIEETNILNRYTGDLVHDHETVMYNYGKRHIECNAHISRYLKGCNENTQNKWALKMRSFLCSLNEYRKKLIMEDIKCLDEKHLEKYSKRYDEIIEEGYEENKKIKSKYLRQDEQRLLNRLRKYKENHIMFLYDFNVPFDNNMSERDLRHIKMKQKISGHFNSMDGMKIYSNIKSIIGTLKKQGRNFYKEIFNIYENIPVNI